MTTPSASVSRRSRPWLLSGVSLAAALASGLGAWMLVLPGGRTTSSRPDWLRPVPPAIVRHLPGGHGTTSSSGGSFAEAFGAAIGPWQAGNHVETAMRLEQLVQQFPDDADVHFYCGTAWLLAGIAAEAVAPLERAVALAPPSLTLEARWYLGLALLESGRGAEARRVFAEACRAGSRQACRAATHLAAAHPAGHRQTAAETSSAGRPLLERA